MCGPWIRHIDITLELIGTGHTPELLNQSLHFTKISREFKRKFKLSHIDPDPRSTVDSSLKTLGAALEWNLYY